MHNADCIPSGWINRDIWDALDPSLRKKFHAMDKGIVSSKNAQGIKIVKPTEPLAKLGYTHKLKILGRGGDIRIYGKQQPNGHIIYDKISRH